MFVSRAVHSTDVVGNQLHVRQNQPQDFGRGARKRTEPSEAVTSNVIVSVRTKNSDVFLTPSGVSYVWPSVHPDQPTRWFEDGSVSTVLLCGR